MNRRAFLTWAAGAACAPSLNGCGGVPNPFRLDDVLEDASFPTGVVAGSPGTDSITLLAHLGDLRGDGPLGVELAEDPDFLRPVLRSTIPRSSDPAVPWRTRLGGLAPGRTYFYRFGARERLSPTGRFRTLPAPDSAAPVRIGFFSCQGWQAGYFNAHRALAAEPELNLALCLGDYIYELTDDTGPADRVDDSCPNAFAQTLRDYRAKYQLYRGDEDLQAMHAAHAFLALWDNHELADDSPGHLMGLKPQVPLAQRRANGAQAFWEYMPMEPGPTSQALYRSLRVSALVELFLLDVQSYAAPAESGGSYLGAAQLDWLLQGLARSTARWKIIANQKVMMGLELAPGRPVNVAQWDGYPAERRRIVEHIRQQQIQGVVTITGDLHTFLAGPVTTTGLQDGEPGLVEFCGGAITSQGLLNLTPDQVMEARGLEVQARRLNPHLAFIDVLARGYGVLEARADELLVTFRSPETVLERGSPTRDLARFRLRHGALSVERL